MESMVALTSTGERLGGGKFVVAVVLFIGFGRGWPCAPQPCEPEHHRRIAALNSWLAVAASLLARTAGKSGLTCSPALSALG